jgi:hypothetical protein
MIKYPEDSIFKHNCTPFFEDGSLNTRKSYDKNGKTVEIIAVCTICKRDIGLIDDEKLYKQRYKVIKRGR